MDKDTDICLNPAWEWPSSDISQIKSVGIRTIENGVTIIKSVYDGYSCVIDPYDEILEIFDNRHNYESMYVVDIPISSCETVYNQLFK